ncbi:MAG: cob(I)yrinic acid a,c-diamide adenosyltransferase [Coriobacteriales bacterium]|jgi:cob(I)alamin adenosyltransferase|nr:cob(I)yrinic acid a,c-diamide adenosyltransferase [Coriobacteriales bacterium]
MTQKDGLIHIYRGDGKGKTTAAVGLACRALTHGLPVLFAQFLKSEATGEAAALERLGARVFRGRGSFGFVYQMDDEQRVACAAAQGQLLAEVDERMSVCAPGLVVLDEVLDAAFLQMIDEEGLRGLIDRRPPGCELVCTGHLALPWLEQRADYITEMRKHRHPYQSGVSARAGIEY